MKVNDYRNGLDIIYDELITKFLVYNNYAGTKFETVWNEVNLIDLTERASARKLNAEAESIELENALIKIELGISTPEEVVAEMAETRQLDESGRIRIKNQINERIKYRTALRVYQELQRKRVN